MPLVEVHVYHNLPEAHVARGSLEAAGIPALLFDIGISGLIAGGMGIRLMVDDEDEHDARALLAAADVA